MRAQRSAYGRAARYERGQMNQTEAAYAHLLEAQKRAGHITEYWYECVSLELGPETRWYPDFLVQLPDGELQLHEVKGRKKTTDGRSTWWAEDAAKVKIRAARGRYPFRVFVVWPAGKRADLHFEQEEIAA